MRSPRSAPAVYYLLTGGFSFAFTTIVTVNMIYQATTVGLNPLQLVLVGTLLEAVCFLFEVPTGVVADSYSRKLSIVIGLVLVGSGFTLEGAVPAFAAVLASQVIWGIGATFLSGAIEAWITDEAGEEAVGHLFLRGGQVHLVAAMAGTVLAVALGLVSLQLAIVTGGVALIALGVVIALVMPESWRPAARDTGVTHARHLAATFGEGLALARQRTTVRMMVAISLFAGLASEAFDRLQTPSILGRFDFPRVFGTDDPVLWFGASGIVGMVLGLAAAEYWKRHRGETLSGGTPARLLAGFAALQVVTLLLFVFAGSLWIAFAALWLRGVGHILAEPVRAAWMNRSIEPRSRATVLSIENQANALGQIGGGPALGWLANRTSIGVSLVGSALLLTPIVGLYARSARREATAGAVVIEET